MNQPIISVRTLHKWYCGVHALKGVKLDVMPEKVLGLVGDTGAGKSTLINILSFLHHQDESEVLVEGKPVDIRNPGDAMALGIETIYQPPVGHANRQGDRFRPKPYGTGRDRHLHQPQLAPCVRLLRPDRGNGSGQWFWARWCLTNAWPTQLSKPGRGVVMAALSGRRVVVTGGLGAIGQAMVAGFAGGGADVTVLDRPGLDPLPGAVQGLTKALARERGRHGITGNAIAPGAVVSDGEARIFGDKADEDDAMVRDRQCLKSRITADDIAAVALFPACDAARMITGQVIAVDGGW